MDFYSTVVTFFQNGGEFMYPIVVLMAVGIAIAIERWMYLTVTMAKNKAVWNAVVPHLKSGNLTGAMAVTSKSDAAIAQIMTYGLNRVKSARRRSDVEQAMEESLMEIMPRLEKRTHYLATFANMATLMGLLGTIIGLIEAFTAVSNANPAEKAELLSKSISIGMNCTAFGLMVAIPLVLIHSVLQTKTTEIIDSLEMAAVKFLNAITERDNPTGTPDGKAAKPAPAHDALPGFSANPAPRRA
jgi:biopolymer transport protein ExbB